MFVFFLLINKKRNVGKLIKQGKTSVNIRKFVLHENNMLVIGY